MNTRKAAIRTAKICFKVLLFAFILAGIAFLGQKAYEYAYAAFCATVG